MKNNKSKKTQKANGNGIIATPPQNNVPTQTIQFEQLQEIAVKLDPQTALQIVLPQLALIAKQLDDERLKNSALSKELSIKNNNEIQLKWTIDRLEQDKRALEQLVSELNTKIEQQNTKIEQQNIKIEQQNTKIEHLMSDNTELKLHMDRLTILEQKRQNKEQYTKFITAIQDVSNELHLREKPELKESLSLLGSDRNVSHHYIHKSMNTQNPNNDSIELINYKIFTMRKQLDSISQDILELFSRDYGSDFINNLRKNMVVTQISGSKLHERIVRKYWDDD